MPLWNAVVRITLVLLFWVCLWLDAANLLLIITVGHVLPPIADHFFMVISEIIGAGIDPKPRHQRLRPPFGLKGETRVLMLEGS